jgi:hypothetical protein
VGGGELDRERGRRAVRVQRRALAADGVEHGGEVLDLVLELERAGERVGQPGPAAVDQDQPRELRLALEQPREGRLLPQVLDVRDDAGDEDEVERPVAEHLVRDRRVAPAGVSRARRHLVSARSSPRP